MNHSATLGSIIHSNLINSCLTITEENEEELEQLRRDDDEEAEQERRKRNQLLKMNDGSAPTVLLHDEDDRADLLENDDQVDSAEKEQTVLANANHSSLVHCEQDDNERLSTIYESPSSHPRTEEEEEEEEDFGDEEEEEEEEITDDPCDKLIVYDIATVQPIRKVGTSISEICISDHLFFSLSLSRRLVVHFQFHCRTRLDSDECFSSSITSFSVDRSNAHSVVLHRCNI
jgi:hypothetical protein